ncbi:hypothetical protein [Phocaeicola plebeius]|jgi:hypothetical protein|uniref:hypothetical protein n=1 Tax=Phocaeicola plebeius TaxID=310297 RepID=UPI00307F9559
MRESVLAVKALAYRAGQGISFDPERYGEGLLRDLENGLDNFLPNIPEQFRAEYEKRYIAKFCEWMQALSRTYSVMITGAGNFNNKRHEKMNRYERSAYDRFTTWRDKVLKRLNREKRLVGWEEVERLQEKLERLTELQEKMKAVNKIVRSKKLSEVEQYEELEALGLSKELINEVMSEPQYAFQKKGFQAYQISNNNAKIKATEEAIRRHTAMAETEDSEIPFEGGKIEMCYSEERIRIYFDERPDAEMIKKLKGAAFKWSPKNVAWQRQLTPNAKYATSRLLGVEI